MSDISPTSGNRDDQTARRGLRRRPYRRRQTDVRLPPAVADLQINFCRNVDCANFGVPPIETKIPGGRQKGKHYPRNLPDTTTASCTNPQCENHGRTVEQARELYNKFSKTSVGNQRYRCRACGRTFAVSSGPIRPDETTHRDLYQITTDKIRCYNCGETAPLKSNAGVSDEITRLARYLLPRQVQSCPDTSCANHGKPITRRDLYHRVGRTEAGSQRYRCRSCGVTFSLAKSTNRQRAPEKNILFMKLLLSRMSLSKIASALEIAPTTVYGKIDFLHEQCEKFMGDRERELAKRRFDDLFLCTDRQSYMCNWTRRLDARNTQIIGIGTADLLSGYILAMNVDFDPEPDPREVEAAAIAAGDYDVGDAFRAYARLRLERDFARQFSQKDKHDGFAEDDEGLEWDRKLPDRGMLVKSEYTMLAHFAIVRRLVQGAQRLAFFTEEETGMRTSMFAAFRDELLDERCEAFQLKVLKELSVARRRALVAEARSRYRKWLVLRRADRTITDEEPAHCRLLRLMEALDTAERGAEGRRWITHPFPNLAEPARKVLHLTARASQDYPEEYETIDDYGNVGVVRKPSHPTGMVRRERAPIDKLRLAMILEHASLHAIDRYFAQVRRELAGLERAIPVSSNSGRLWYGYTPYNPQLIPKLLTIHRTYYNMIQIGEDGRTRAERFGIARGKIRFQDIIYYR